MHFVIVTNDKISSEQDKEKQIQSNPDCILQTGFFCGQFNSSGDQIKWNN